MNNSEKISNRRKADSMIFPIDCWTWNFFFFQSSLDA